MANSGCEQGISAARCPNPAPSDPAATSSSGRKPMARLKSSSNHLQTPTVDNQWPTQSTASDLAADHPRNPSKIQAPASVQGWPIHELPQKSTSKRAGHEQSSSLHPAPIRSSRCSGRQHQWPSAITPKPPPAATDPAFHGAQSTSNDPASTHHAQILATNSRLQAMAPEQTMQQSSARTHRTSSMTVKASAIGHGQRLTAVVQHHASSEPTRSPKQRSTVRSTMGHQGSSGDESDGQRPATIRAGRASSRNPLSLPRTNGTWKQAAIAVTN
ncbi:hypothetical protein ACLOJK_027290 [Asimina triloba]